MVQTSQLSAVDVRERDRVPQAEPIRPGSEADGWAWVIALASGLAIAFAHASGMHAAGAVGGAALAWTVGVALLPPERLPEWSGAERAVIRVAVGVATVMAWAL